MKVFASRRIGILVLVLYTFHPAIPQNIPPLLTPENNWISGKGNGF